MSSWIDWLNDFEYQKLQIPAPNIVIYLRVDPEVSQKLLAKRYAGDMSKEGIHEKDHEYLIRCGEAAEYCVKRQGWKTVKCTRNGEMKSIEEIHKEILQIVENS